MTASSLTRLAVLLALTGCPETPPDPPTCGPGELRDDADACVPQACGTGAWGSHEPHPTEPTYHVLASAEAPGDGSAEAPFPRLSSALEAAVAAPGGRVLIGAGRYLDHLSFSRAHDGLELIGRCTELAIVDGEGLAAPTLAIFASSVVVRSLTITGGRPGVIAGEVPGAPGLVLRGNDLVIDGNGGYGVLATGQGVLVDLAESRIQNISPTNDVSPARGIGVEQTATLVGQGIEVRGVIGIGLEVMNGSSAEIERLELAPMLAQDDGTYGRGIHVTGGALTLRDSVIERQPEIGVQIVNGGSLVFTDGRMEGGTITTVARSGGSLVLERSQLVAPSGRGLAALGPNTLVDLRASSATGTGDAGPLVSVEDGAGLVAEGLSVEGGYGVAVHIAGLGSAVRLRDTDVLSTGGDAPDGSPGIAVLVSDGADLEGDDLLVSGATGPGFVVARGATATCLSCRVTDATFAAAWVSDDGDLRLEGGQLTSTRTHPTLQGGVGALGAGGGAGGTRLQLDDTSVLDMPHAGVAVRGAGAFRLAGAIIDSVGLLSAAPGVLATEGTGFWQGAAGPGLFIFDVTFRQLPNDAILMDGATGTVSGSTFDGVGQLELYTQNCGGVLAPDVAEDLQTNDCVGPPRVLGPTLQWPSPPLAPGYP